MNVFIVYATIIVPPSFSTCPSSAGTFSFHICSVVHQLLQDDPVLSDVLKLSEQFSPNRRDGLVCGGRRRAHVHGQQPDARDVFRRRGGLHPLRRALVHLVHVGLKRLIGQMIDAVRKDRPAGPPAGSQLHVDVHLQTDVNTVTSSIHAGIIVVCLTLINQ